MHRQFASKVAFAVGLLLTGGPLASCTPNPALPPIRLLLDFPGDYPPCGADQPSNQSPEEWERQDFHRRFSKGVLVLPVNVPCVQQAFTATELNLAAERGDPVATLVAVMMKYQLRGEAACRDIGQIRRSLTGAYTSTNPYQGGPISRVPEAAYILALIEAYCSPGTEDYDRLQMIAFDLGYDASAARLPLPE